MKTQTLSHKRFFFVKQKLETWKFGGKIFPAFYPTFLILVFGILLSGCSDLSGEAVELMTPPTAEFTFDRYEVVIGPAKHQTVLTGFLLDGPIAELAVIHIDENNDHCLRLYTFSGDTWVPTLNATLGSEVSFVDVANIGGRDRLVTYARDRLNWFEPNSGTARALVGVTSNFTPPRSGEIPHVDITQDVNADGLDDLVVPDADGFWVFIQRRDGTFAEKVQIGPPTEMARIRGADGYRYDPWSQSRIHEIDYDRDGRVDLAFWHEDHFEVHLQDERGLFTSNAKIFMTGVAFDADRRASLITGDMTGKVLHALTDLNGDGVADLVIFKLSGSDLSSKHSSYEVHFGAPTSDGGTVFARNADITFQSNERIQLGMDPHDLDRDGQAELMITTINREFLKGSLWKRIKGFMGDDVWLDIEFYQMEEGGSPDTPNTTRSIALDGVPSHREPGWVPLDLVLRGATHERRKTQERWPRAFNTTLRIGDVTGDGRADLLLGDHPRIMIVFVGVPGPELFAQQPQEVAVSLPNDEEYTWLVDLNKDGVQDLLMHHPFTLRDGHGARLRPLGTEPHRVVLLIAR